MGKNGNGEGSIYPVRDKNGKIKGYRAAYVVHTAVGPKRRYLSGKRREDVRDKLIEALGNRAQGLVFDAGTLTVGEYLDRWLKDSLRGTVRASTVERHEINVRTHIKPCFGHVRLKGLTPAHVRGLHREKLDGGLSPATVRKIHSTLHKALTQAVADGLLPRNAAAVKAPRPAPREMRPLSEEEARRFLDAASEAGDPFEALYVLAITAGLRRGELLALRWDDLDLERGTLRVARSLTREKGRYLMGDTKTKKGRRRVNLTPRTVAALKAHRKRQLEERVRLAGLYEDRGLVFSTGTGAIVSPENLVKRSFRLILKAAGLPEIRFHDLRHTCATILLGRAVHPKLVQELLGHATVAMTLDTYSHYLPSMGDAAGGAMGEAFG
jgi:integrase